ncbi:MAG: ATP-binding cassette domain-containing protein [Nanoarchaeota archaeon]|nr:ATP-binding cassette domain-containing protein [Nanoarchaeota archaeon]
MHILRLVDVSLEKEGRSILRNISFSINKGEIHAVLGANGAGKSTLARAIMGIEKANGKILFKEREISNLSITKRAKQGIRFMQQSPPSFEGIKIREYIKIDSAKSIEEIRKILEKVGLPAKYSERFLDDSLSGGERKRVELASLLAANPELIILDEPDSGIDMVSINRIKKIILEMNKNGSTILLITHKESMTSIADKAHLMVNGKIVASGAPKEINKLFKGLK